MTRSVHRATLRLVSLVLGCAAQNESPTHDGSAGTEGDSTAHGDSSSEASDASSDDDSDAEHTSGSSSSAGAPDEEPPQPEVLWRSTVSSGFASAVVGTADGGAIVVGSTDQFEGRAIAVRVDDRGEVVWKRILAPQDEHANYYDLAVAADGAIWVAGRRAWMSDLSPSRSIVLERLDADSGEVLWADPGITLEGFVSPSHDLFAVLALPEGGVIVAGSDADEDGAAHPWLRRHADDGTVVWQGRTPEEGRVHDLVRVDDRVLAVGVQFDSSVEYEPVAPWAMVIDLDGELVATPKLPPGRADLVFALVMPELGPAALGGRYVVDGISLDEDVGWLQPIAVDGSIGEPLPLPTRLAGAVALPTGELVVGHGDTIEAYDPSGTLLWELEDVISMLDNDNDLLALASNGHVLAAGGFEQMELIEIALPQR